MDLLAIGLAKKVINLSVSGWKSMSMNGQTGEITGTTNDGKTFTWRFPIPKDGKDGQNGRDGIDGKDGLPGQDGAPGKDGLNGLDGKDGQDGAPGKDGEPGKDGLPGRDGIDGLPGADGKDGQDGVPGKDGYSIYVATNVHGSDSNGYFIPEEVTTYDREVQVGDLILCNTELYFIDEIVHNQYWYHKALVELRGPEGPQGPPGKDGDPGAGKLPYTYLRQLNDYLYEIQFDSVVETEENDDNYSFGGCSTFTNNQYVYRNFDYNYTSNASFFVRTPNYKGLAFVDGLYNGEMYIWDNDKIEKLPNRLVDGINTSGVFVSTHIIYNDFDYRSYVGPSGIYAQNIVSLILENCRNWEEVEDYINSIKDRIVIPEALSSTEHIPIYFIKVEGLSYVLQPINGNYSLYPLNSMSLPKLTNFLHYGEETVSKNDVEMQARPNGIERYNSITLDTHLSDLRYTKAYESTDWLSEFIGINGTTKESDNSQLVQIYEEARNAYLTRVRDGKTWQTVHSVVYDLDSYAATIYVQEDWTKSYDEKSEEIEVEIDSEMSSTSRNPVQNRVIKEYVDNAAKIPGPPGPQGEPGAPGEPGQDGQPGIDGIDGQDGFSPIISVKEQTDESYILAITDKEGVKETPNLMGPEGPKGEPGESTPASMDYEYSSADEKLKLFAGQGGSSELTEEHLTGETFNGKLVFEKVFVDTIKTLGTLTAMSNSVIDNLDEVISIDAIVTHSNGGFYPTSFRGTGTYSRAVYNKTNGLLYGEYGDNSFLNSPIKAVIKYTKTTD